MESLGDRIRLARQRLGFSQPELAARLGVSKAAVSAWESALKVPRKDRIDALAKLSGLPVGWFYDPATPVPSGPVGAKTIEDAFVMAVEAALASLPFQVGPADRASAVAEAQALFRHISPHKSRE